MLREVSKKITFVADFGTPYTGLATVGYKLVNGDGTTFQARTTTGVSEITAGTGAYKVEVANSVFTTDFDGLVEWDTGGGSPVYVYEDVHIVAELDATVSSRSTYDGTDTSGTTTLLSRLTSGRASNLDNLDATVSSRSTVAAIWAAVVDSSGVTTLLSRLSSARAGYLDQIPGIATATDLLGTHNVSVVGPVLASGQLELVQGDDYKATDGRALTFSSASWPTLTAGTVALKLRNSPNATATSYAGTVLSASSVQVELTAAQTALLSGSYKYDIVATLSNGDVATLAHGNAKVAALP